MARRWVRYELPAMVCVEISETEELEEVIQVVLGVEESDIVLARDAEHRVLVFDENMERVAEDEPLARAAVSLAEARGEWPERDAWEEGPDALRDRWLYDEGDVEGVDLAARGAAGAEQGPLSRR